ncbi:alpha-amylase family glycosyl hydrolase [Candidatus Izemoplasma sp. B36]|uniref:alpha-amylase family glycosyl hydrolase n=1 Tax=Candidatus Izemoplasma sp. B36 TaxID=3242468 RepID=UPI003557D979
MFKKIMIFICFIITIPLISCGEKTTIIDYVEQDLSVESGYLVDNIQEGTILHAWNWSMTTIEEKLEDIAIAGFSSVQISPMQPQKDYYGVASWGSSWWKFYQPLGFSIATEEHAIGTKTQLESLCETADEYGIKIIVDVVVNHLAGGTSESLNPDVINFEPEIYNNSLFHTGIGAVSDYSQEQVIKGYMAGFPDLQTENQTVQDAVLDLLKEYIDVGVDGFRFDAAKHVETPSDGEYASDFWPTILDGATQYAENSGKTDLFFYGEILNTAGENRSYAYYTDMMLVTDNELSKKIRNAIVYKMPERLSDLSYSDGILSNQAVLWAESHDTYANSSQETTNISTDNINKAYVIAASRRDATALYFARPNELTLIGECGTYDWQSIEVSNINKFHNYFYDSSESISVQEGFFINERYNSEDYGVVLVDILGEQEVSKLPVSNIADGDYVDQISGNIFEVKNGKISGEIDESGIAIIYNNNFEPKPVVYVSNDGSHGTITDTITIDVFSYNATSANYSINGGEKIEFIGNIELELSHPGLNAVITLDFELWFNEYKIEKHYEYIKSNIVIDEVVVNNLDPNIIGNSVLVAWVWENGQEGAWVEGIYQDGSFTFDIPIGSDNFLLVLFPENTTEYDWDIKQAQTNDVEIPSDGIYDGSTLIW